MEVNYIQEPVRQPAVELAGKGGEQAARCLSCERAAGTGVNVGRVQETGDGRCVMLKKNPLSLAKTEPASAISPFEEFERRFEDFFRRPFSMMESPWWMRWPGLAGEVSPAMDVYEEGGDIVVKAEIPGMKKEEIHVDINEKSVTVSGEKKKEEKIEKKNYVHLERTSGSFARTFTLPAEVQTDKARATFKDGILEIRVPKTAEAASRARKVAVE
jgi:HSP20 family protein